MGKREYLNIINLLKQQGLVYTTDSFTGKIQLLTIPTDLEMVLLKTTRKNKYIIHKCIKRKAVYAGCFTNQTRLVGFQQIDTTITIRKATPQEIQDKKHYTIQREYELI